MTNPSSTHYLPYAHQSINEADIEEVAMVMRNPIISRGPKVEEFERAVADFCGAEYAIAFNSGSTALNAAYQAIDANQHDKIFTSANTYVATVSGGVQRGATPVFTDIDLGTGNLQLQQLEFNLNQPSSRGRDIIVPVHFAGIAVDMAKLDQLIKKESTVVIEDAAHAFGSHYPTGEKVGSCCYSQMTVFSFHPAKTITTGEGGIVTTNDPVLFRRLRQVRNNGIDLISDPNSRKKSPWMYEVNELSSNYNFTEIQAALGLSQLRRIHEFENKRRHLIQLYRESFRGEKGIKMFTAEYDPHTLFHISVLMIDFDAFGLSKSEVMLKLEANGIGSQVHYIPLYKHPFFMKNHPDLSQYFPNTELYYSQALTIPLFYDLTISDAHRVVSTLKSILRKNL